MNKKLFFGLLIGIGAIILLAVATYAAGWYPENVERWTDSGLICYLWPDGSGDCYVAPCNVCSYGAAEVIPEATGRPETSVAPTSVVPPTVSVPTAIPTEKPEPTQKPACNRGLGNGSEVCDPGASGGKPGRAGEGDG